MDLIVIEALIIWAIVAGVGGTVLGVAVWLAAAACNWLGVPLKVPNSLAAEAQESRERGKNDGNPYQSPGVASQSLEAPADELADEEVTLPDLTWCIGISIGSLVVWAVAMFLCHIRMVQRWFDIWMPPDWPPAAGIFIVSLSAAGVTLLVWIWIGLRTSLLRAVSITVLAVVLTILPILGLLAAFGAL